MWGFLLEINQRARRVNVRFVRVLGRGKRIFKDSVRLIARFYSRSEYDKPLECKTNYFNFGNGTTRIPRTTIHFGHISVYK